MYEGGNLAILRLTLGSHNLNSVIHCFARRFLTVDITFPHFLSAEHEALPSVCCYHPNKLRWCLCIPQGAAVLRMLSDFLTEPVFAKGLSVSITPCQPASPLNCHRHRALCCHRCKQSLAGRCK